MTEESEKLEFKARWKPEYLKVISALANTAGGQLWIGIDDTGKFIGLEDAEKLVEELPGIIRNRLGILPSVRMDVKEGRKAVVISITQSSMPVSYNGRYYARSGSTTVELRGRILADFLMRRLGKSWDDYIEERAKPEDIDPETIRRFALYAKNRIPSLALETDYMRILEKLHLVEEGRLKRAAILLFGRDPRRFYPQAHVRIGRFRSEAEMTDDNMVVGNLFQQVEEVFDLLTGRYIRYRPEINGIRRVDTPEYPIEALREAVINAIIHRDYMGTSAVQIRVYDDRLVISNEGHFPPEVPPEKLKVEHISKPRNPNLASVFYFAGFIESWGSGTLKILDLCKKAGLPEPQFSEENGVVRTVFMADILSEDYLRGLGMNERQIRALEFVKKSGRITNREYQDINRTSERTALRDLREMVSKSLLERVGETGKGTYYILKTGASRQTRHKPATNPPSLNNDAHDGDIQ